MGADEPRVIALSEAASCGPAAVGNKAVNLARLMRARVRVPDGFCLATRAYRDFVDHAGLGELVQADELAGHELELGTGELADDAEPGGLLPPRLGLAVVHDHVGEAQVAAHAEVVDRAVELALEDEGRVAEGAEGDGDGDAAGGSAGDR